MVVVSVCFADVDVTLRGGYPILLLLRFSLLRPVKGSARHSCCGVDEMVSPLCVDGVP